MALGLYCSPEYQISFDSFGFSVQEKQFKIHFQEELEDSCDLEF